MNCGEPVEIFATISHSTVNVRHCHAEDTNCDNVNTSTLTISGAFEIQNISTLCDITLKASCGPTGLDWLEFNGLMGFREAGTENPIEVCDAGGQVQYFKLTDGNGVEIDTTVDQVIQVQNTAQFYWSFGICSCCLVGGELQKLFNNKEFAVDDIRFHIEVPDCDGEDAYCCYLTQDYRAGICAAGDTVYWKDNEGFIAELMTFDGSGSNPGDSIVKQFSLNSQLFCDVDDTCVKLTDAAGDPYVGGDAVLHPDFGNLCPSVGTLPNNGDVLFQCTWTIPLVNPTSETIFAEWNYCDACGGEQCCDGGSDPQCNPGTITYRMQFNLVAPPLIDCSACLDATYSAIPEDCEGTCDGEATVTINQGCTLPMNVVSDPPVWFPAVDPADITNSAAIGTSTAVNLCGGVNYTVTLTDDDGCQSQIFFTTPVVDTIDVILTYEPIPCSGDLTDILSVITGGRDPYAFVWTASNGGVVPPGQINLQNLSGVGPGTYELTTTDDNGCISVDNIIVTQPTPLNVSSAITDESCLGSCDGTIILDVSGGTAPYTYFWVSPSSTFTSNAKNLSSLCAGDYDVTVKDANGCLALLGNNTVNPGLAIEGNYIVTDKLCNGSSDGAITTAGVTGGTGPYTFVWTDPAGDQFSTLPTVTGLSLLGLYTVQITDSNQCFIAEGYTLGVQNNHVIESVVNQLNLCNGDCLSEIDLTITGGIGPYTFVWTGPPGFVDPGTEDLTALCAGDYSVIVTDSALGCEAGELVGINITEPFEIEIVNLYANSLNCHDEKSACIEFAIVGGVAPYTYSWEYNDTSGPGWLLHPASVNKKALCFDSSGFIDPGNPAELEVRIVVTDFGGCIVSSDPVTVCNPPELIVACNTTPQSAPGLSDGTAQFTMTEIGAMSCNPAVTATLTLSTGDIFPGLVNASQVTVTNKFCQTISWTLTNTEGCQVQGTCEIDCPPDPGVEGCCDDPEALNHNCEGCEEPDPDACKYDHITCPVDWINVDGNPLPNCISSGTNLTFQAAPHFPNRVTCDPPESCCDEYGTTPEWDSVVTYSIGDLVWFTDEADIYRSLQDINLDNLPEGTAEDEWWEKCCECGDDPVADPCYKFAEITVVDSTGTTTIITFTNMPDTEPNFPPGGIVVDWTMCQDFLENIENFPIDHVFTTDGSLGSGELTINMKLWDCFETYECCEQKVVLCKDIRTAQVTCHTWKVLDLSPAIGYNDLYPAAEWTEKNKIVLTNYEGTYTETIWANTGVSVQFVVPIDDVYVVKVERFYVFNDDPLITASLWDEPKYLIIYEFCVLLKCVKAIILDIFCSGVDCCADDCNEKDREKEDAKRYMLNKVVALWSSMLGFIQKDKLKYLDLFYVDDPRAVSVKQIHQMMGWIKDMSSTCKPCVEGDQIEIDNFAGYPTTPATGDVVDGTPPLDNNIINPECCD